MALSPRVEWQLKQTSQSWKWKLLLDRIAVLGCSTIALLLALGIAMQGGSFDSFKWPSLLLTLLAVGGLLGLLVILVVTVDMKTDRRFLAASLEKVHRPLLDRLNTLVHLQSRNDPVAHVLRPAIEEQAAGVLTQEPEVCPFPWGPTRIRWTVLASLLALAVLFFCFFQPWLRVQATTTGDDPDVAEASLEIPPDQPIPAAPTSNPLERKEWTEVRISTPGRDLSVTQYEVVPLVVEAASNCQLRRWEWFSSVNGGEEQVHALPDPDDPGYAVYETELMLEDFQLQPWDVLAYFARATTKDGQQHDSRTHFINVVPERKQLDRLPGGDQGPAADALQEVTDLIGRQQEILRQTQRAAKLAAESRQLPARKLEELAQQERQLREDLPPLPAALRSRLGAAPSQGLDALARNAEQALGQAAEQLQQQQAAAAETHERRGLANLVAIRKQIEQLALENPEAFEVEPSTRAAEQTQMQASQQELQDAREFVQQQLLQQRNIERDANPRRVLPELALRQRRLQQELQRYLQDHPQPFQQLSGECRQATAAMQRAVQALTSRPGIAQQAAHESANTLQELDDSLEREQQQNRLADAYRLRQQLDQQIQQLQQFADQPQSAGPSQRRAAAGQCTSITGQLQRLANEQGTSKRLQVQLQAAVAEESKARVDSQSDALAAANGAEQTQRAAGELAQSLEQIIRKLGGNPSGTEKSSSPGLQPVGQQAVERGMRQLDSLLRRQAQGPRFSPEANSELKRDAVRNVSEGIRGTYGHNEQLQQTLQRLRENAERDPAAPDLETVRRLSEQIQALRRETVRDDTQNETPEEFTGIDPTRVPPEYRQPIRQYFEELSRQPRQ